MLICLISENIFFFLVKQRFKNHFEFENLLTKSKNNIFSKKTFNFFISKNYNFISGGKKKFKIISEKYHFLPLVKIHEKF